MTAEQERRIDTRNHSYAKAFMPDHNAIGYVRDISRNGFRIEAIGSPGFSGGEEVTVVLIPNEETRFPPFTVRGRVQWMHDNSPTYSIGIAIACFVSPGSRRLFGKFRKRWYRLVH